MSHSTRNSDYPKGLLLATSLGFAVVQLDVSVVNVAINAIGRAFGGNTSNLQWVVSVYTLAFAALIITAGSLGDRQGSKRIFLIGFVLFILASIACGLADSLWMLIVTRVFQGMAAAMLVPCSLALLNHASTDEDQRTHALGLWAAGASVALAGGPLVGGILTAALGWRAIFFINVPIGLVGVWAASRFAHETPRTVHKDFDISGQLISILALAALAWAAINGGRLGFTSHEVILSFTVAILAGMGFIAVERAKQDPMLPLHLFRSAVFSAMTSVGLLVNVAFYGFIFVLSLFFQQTQHFTPLHTGLLFAPMTIAIFLGNIMARRITAAVNERLSMLAALTAIIIGSGLLLSIDTSSSYSSIVFQLIIIGFGLGVIVPLMTSSLLSSVSKTISGVASGVLNTARQTGSVIGVALFGSFIANGEIVLGLHKAAVGIISLMASAIFLVIWGARK